jgi:hypothetical protein
MLRHRVLCELHMLMRFLRAKGQGESSTEIQELLLGTELDNELFQPPSPQPDCSICFLPLRGPRQSPPYMVLRKKYCVMDAYMCIICLLNWKIFVRFFGRRYWLKKIKLSTKSDWRNVLRRMMKLQWSWCEHFSWKRKGQCGSSVIFLRHANSGTRLPNLDVLRHMVISGIRILYRRWAWKGWIEGYISLADCGYWGKPWYKM